MFIRPISPYDYGLLKESLEVDKYHNETTPDFFYDSSSQCNVYGDEDKGPIMFVRGTKALRLDIHFLDNEDYKHNAEMMLKGFEGFVKQVKDSGFTEIIFNSTSPLLVKFCKEKFGFIESGDELRKQL